MGDMTARRTVSVWSEGRSRCTTTYRRTCGEGNYMHLEVVTGPAKGWCYGNEYEDMHRTEQWSALTNISYEDKHIYNRFFFVIVIMVTTSSLARGHSLCILRVTLETPLRSTINLPRRWTRNLSVVIVLPDCESRDTQIWWWLLVRTVLCFPSHDSAFLRNRRFVYALRSDYGDRWRLCTGSVEPSLSTNRWTGKDSAVAALLSLHFRCMCCNPFAA